MPDERPDANGDADRELPMSEVKRRLEERRQAIAGAASILQRLNQRFRTFEPAASDFRIKEDRSTSAFSGSAVVSLMVSFSLPRDADALRVLAEVAFSAAQLGPSSVQNASASGDTASIAINLGGRRAPYVSIDALSEGTSLHFISGSVYTRFHGASLTERELALVEAMYDAGHRAGGRGRLGDLDPRDVIGRAFGSGADLFVRAIGGTPPGPSYDPPPAPAPPPAAEDAPAPPTAPPAPSTRPEALDETGSTAPPDAEAPFRSEEALRRALEEALRPYELSKPAAAAPPGRAAEGYGESAKAEAQLEAMGLRVFRRPEQTGAGGGAPSAALGLDWTSFAGYEDIKREVEDAVVLSFRYPSLFESITRGTRKRPERSVPRAVLFEGPPGTGKTFMARILAAQCDAPLVYLPLESIMTKWFGESERNLSRVFALCRKLAPGVLLFVDEVDALGPSRDGPMNSGLHESSRRLMSTLLRHVDGFESEGGAASASASGPGDSGGAAAAAATGDSQRSRVVLVGATNRPEDLDAALLR
eukprot:tig00000411_g525.t1